MHDRAETWPPTTSRFAVDFGPGTVAVTHIDGTRERISLAQSRELVLCRLLARGLTPATLRILLPERRSLIDQLAS